VLRLLKVFKYLSSLRKIGEVLYKGFTSFFAIVVLLVRLILKQSQAVPLSTHAYECNTSSHGQTWPEYFAIPTGAVHITQSRLLRLQVLFWLVFTIFGMNVFGGLQLPPANAYPNFDTFMNALLSTFNVLNLENWNQQMFAVADASNDGAVIYYLLWILLGKYTLLSLFLAVMLEAFEVSASQVITCDCVQLLLPDPEQPQVTTALVHCIPTTRPSTTQSLQRKAIRE
jgi:hypothetical protein